MHFGLASYYVGVLMLSTQKHNYISKVVTDADAAVEGLENDMTVMLTILATNSTSKTPLSVAMEYSISRAKRSSLQAYI